MTTSQKTADDLLARARAALDQIGGVNGNGVNDWAPLATAEALVSIAETLKLLIQPDPATRETFICFDCGRTAGPSCGYFGHGIEDLGSIMDSFTGSSEPPSPGGYVRVDDVTEALDAIDKLAEKDLDHELHATVEHYRGALGVKSS